MFSQRRNKVSPDRISATHNPDDGIKASGVFPFSTKNPNDFRAGFEVLYSLIECRVVERLEQIFEHVRRIEESGSNHAATRRAIRLPEVLDMLGISKSTLYSRSTQRLPITSPLCPSPSSLVLRTVIAPRRSGGKVRFSPISNFAPSTAGLPEEGENDE